jgi:hypothetical protein
VQPRFELPDLAFEFGNALLGVRDLVPLRADLDHGWCCAHSYDACFFRTRNFYQRGRAAFAALQKSLNRRRKICAFASS